MNTVISPDTLKHLDGRAASMLALLKKQDTESLATSSAKRRFFRIELETSGIMPDQVSQDHVDAARAAGCNSLATWLDSLRRLCEYARSEARRKWNPAAKATDLASQVPVASDWFLQSTYLPEWEEMDFLSRCESIWTANGFTGEGMMFTRIFNYRVKMLTGYEDGLRLVLLLTETGDYVPPLDLPKREPVRVEPIDLVRRSLAYDGPEPKDYAAKVQVPLGKPEWAFSFSEIVRRPFEELRDILGEKAFAEIMEKMGYAYPKNEFETYVGDDDLALYYYVRDDETAGARKLVLVGMGEFQPGRYMATVEGFWRVFGANI
ncbi:MAG TPA: hypothetical protein VHS96_14670 [Bacteroidia bacterium]|nr:hypothetical protein [Bacteroidia bacterium]